MNEHIFLLHGLWMRAISLVVLRRRLERSGYAVELFDYASVLRRPEIAVQRLIDRVHRYGDAKVHLVGHSLGGLIALTALLREPDLIGGRVVCLGSPLRGSAVARGLASTPGCKWLLGQSRQFLHDGLALWQGRQEVGVIAGSLPIGFGSVFSGLSAPHDGTVSVDESEIPGLTDHCVVATTHTGLLFSKQVASQIVSFLRSGRFGTDI